MDIRKITVPYLPRHIEVGPNGKLLPDDEIERIKKLMPREGKYSRKILACTHPAIFTGGKYFILCPGDDYGSGGYGKIIPAQDADTGEFAAVKMMLKAPKKLIQKDETWVVEETLTDYAIAHESEFLKDLGLAVLDAQGHPLKFMHASRSDPEYQKCVMVMKWLPGETISELNLHPLPLIVRLELIEKMLQAVKACHDTGILHRDLKDDNFMYDFAANLVTLIDYGLARHMNEERAYHDTWPVGRSSYIAPELFKLFDTRFIQKFAHEKLLDLILRTRKDLLAMDNPTKEKLHKTLAGEYVYNDKTEIYSLGMTIKDMTLGIEPELRQPFMAQAELMMDPDPDKRPYLSACLEYFRELKQRLSVKDRTYRVGLMDIRDFDNIRQGNERPEFIWSLKEYHQIVFIDDDLLPSKALYADVIFDLAECGITHVSRDIYQTPLTSRFVSSLQKQLSSQHDDMCIFRFYHLKPDRVIEIRPAGQQESSSLAARFGIFQAANDPQPALQAPAPRML